MGGAINPSGVELAAGIAFFAAAIPLLYAPAAARNTTLLWHTGIAALGAGYACGWPGHCSCFWLWSDSCSWSGRAQLTSSCWQLACAAVVDRAALAEPD